MNRPQLLWRYHTDESNFPTSTAAVIDHRTVLVTFYNCDLALLSLDNGSELWKRRLPAQPSSCKPLNSRKALVTTLEGHLLYIDLESGEDLWINRTPQPIYSVPLVVDREIYFGSDDYHLYCVDLETGETTFKLQTEDCVRTNPASYRNLILFGSHDNNVYCFDRVERRVVWTYQTKFLVRTSPAILQSNHWLTDSVCIASWRDMVCLDIQTGNERWVHPTESEIWCQPLIHRDNLVFTTSLITGLVYCLNKYSGSINWFKRYGEVSAGQPVHYNRDAFLLKCGTSIIGLNIHDGSELWKIEELASLGTPLVANDRLFFYSHDSLLCYDLFGVR